MLLGRLLAVALLAVLPPSAALGWEDDGHKIVADVAEALLTPAARSKVDRLLNGARMRGVANYADDIRPFQPQTRAGISSMSRRASGTTRASAIAGRFRVRAIA
jgi:hypothetical protein